MVRRVLRLPQYEVAVLLALAAGLPGWGGAVDDAPPSTTNPPPTNVNARYIIESVNVVGVEARAISTTLSSSLRAELKQVVGANLDSTRLEKLAGRIKDELRVDQVKSPCHQGHSARSRAGEFRSRQEAGGSEGRQIPV